MDVKVIEWEPPAGMKPEVRRAWMRFYGRALDVYGITPHQYRLLYVAQRGRCWICRKARGIHPDDPHGLGAQRLGVDHNHVTGAVRGLLCARGDKSCNRIIGWLDLPALKRAAGYLEHPPASVLAEIRHMEEGANAAGIGLTQAEIDSLAQDYLWADMA